MQPSYIYCKICGFTLNYVYVEGRKVVFPTDNEGLFSAALNIAREKIRCPGCGNKKWIRKVYWKV
jgi:ribosomal protein S27E